MRLSVQLVTFFTLLCVAAGLLLIVWEPRQAVVTAGFTLDELGFALLGVGFVGAVVTFIRAVLALISLMRE